MHSSDVESPERRNFLRAVPAAAAAGLIFADASLFGVPAEAQMSGMEGAPKYEVISASQFEEDIKASQAHPGNKMLYQAKTFTIVLTAETNAVAQEFE